MKDWIKAYWNYRLELAKEKRIVKIEVDWLSLFFWATVMYLILKDQL